MASQTPNSIRLGNNSFHALCADGTPPMYWINRGFGAGKSNWLIYFEGKTYGMNDHF